MINNQKNAREEISRQFDREQIRKRHLARWDTIKKLASVWFNSNCLDKLFNARPIV